MNLVIDIGNTRIKTALFRGDKLQSAYTVAQHENISLESVFQDFKHDVDRCILSSVTTIPAPLSGFLKKASFPSIQLGPDTPLPFRNNYQSPSSLGPDRLAAIAGACCLYPSDNVLVIDAGTAITYEFKNSKDEYLGGNISPGLSLRFKALHEYTSKLPLLQAEPGENLVGTTTREAILNGVQNGLICEVEGYIEKFNTKYPDLKVILTGGDAHFFDNKLKKTIFVVSNLTLLGLNFILRYNAEKY